MKTTSINTATLKFLKALKKNNNRDWFTKNKDKYLLAKDHVNAFAQTLIDEMSHHDNIERIKVYRIYRDVRFSKDKTPYKQSMSLFMSRATKWLRGGYYLHIEPGNSFLGGGFWGPNGDDIKRIRREIARDDKSLRKVLNAAKFKKTFGELRGTQLKTAPRGYEKDHPAVDLLRYKQYLLIHSFTDEQVMAANFSKEVTKTFKTMRPFLNYMSEVLTTDENGVPIE